MTKQELGAVKARLRRGASRQASAKDYGVD
jgi:hypothetical protein